MIPYLQETYFNDNTERAIAKVIIKFHQYYGKCPNAKEVVVELKELPNIVDLDKNVVNDVLGNNSYVVTDQEWLVTHTEKFIQRRRVSEAFSATYGAFENGDDVTAIPNVFQEALSF